MIDLALKCAWLGVNELAGDEPFTVYWAQRPLADLFAMLRTENNPPLYFLLMHAWSLLVPLDEAWLRLPSAVFSALTVWPLFLTGRRLGGLPVAITASLLFTLSQHQYGFAHEVRAYSLMVLLSTWGLWQLVRMAQVDDGQVPKPDRNFLLSPLLWLAVANVLLTWTHFFGWLVIGLQILLVLTVPALHGARKSSLIAAGIAVLFSIPYAAILSDRAGSSLEQGTWLNAPGWEEPYNMVMRWSNAPVVAVLFLLAITIALIRGKRGSTLVRIPFLWCAVPLIGMFLVSFLFPIYLDRYLLFASIGFYLLVAQATQLLSPVRGVRIVAAAVGIIAMAITFNPWKDTGQHPSMVMQQVDAWTTGPTRVIIQPGWYGLTYAWQLDRSLFRDPMPIERALMAQDVFLLVGPSDLLVDTARSVIYIDAWAKLTDPNHRVVADLRSHLDLVDSIVMEKPVQLKLFHQR